MVVGNPVGMVCWGGTDGPGDGGWVVGCERVAVMELC